MKEKTSSWKINIALSILLIVYICLTTAIFVLRKQHQDVDKLLASNNAEEQQVDVASSKKATNTIIEYETLLKKEPNNSDAHFALGQMYMVDKDNAEKALHHLNKTIELNPKHRQKEIIKVWIKKLEVEE